MIVTEKRTLTTQIESWFADMGVAIVPLGGYSSESFDRAIEGEFGDERRYHALYVGDFDPSGEDIERHGEEEFGWVFREWERVLLTPEIVDEYNLPVAPGKTSGSRAARFEARHGQLVQVEVEALDPDVLRALLAEAIDENWDTSAFDDVLEREREGREALLRVAREMTG